MWTDPARRAPLPSSFLRPDHCPDARLDAPGVRDGGHIDDLVRHRVASANPVVFSVDPTSGTGVCTVSGTNGTTLSYTGAGSRVTDANYAAAQELTELIPVSSTAATNQKISFHALPSATPAQSPNTVGAPSPSGLPVSFTTTTPTVCTSGGMNGPTISERP
jgi:hypothetical protein